MISVPPAFVPDPKTGLATPQPAVDWFAAGLGVAYRRWDGISYLLLEQEGALVPYRELVLEPDEPRPARFIQTSDAGVTPITGWEGIGNTDVVFVNAVQAVLDGGRGLRPGLYELCGPGIAENREGLSAPALFRHDLVAYLRTPRTLDELIAFMLLQEQPGAGLVWRYGDAVCGLHRLDVGLPWPPTA